MYKNTRIYSVISYITWIGFAIAFFCRDKDDQLVRRHLNQALTINLIETAARIIGRLGGIFGALAGIVDLCVLVLFIMGIVRACKLSDEPLPIIGDIQLI